MNRVGFFILIAAIASLIAGIVNWQRDPFDVATLIARPSASADWTTAAEKALARVSIGTRYAGRWQTGKMPQLGRLSLVLIDSDRSPGSGLTTTLRRNCTYTGRDELIVCDVALVRRFLAERDLDKTTKSVLDSDGHVIDSNLVPLGPDLIADTRLLMLQWILGHELGHILNGDGQAHFAGDRLDDPVKPASFDHARELAADGFLAKQFGGTPTGPDNEFYLFLIRILQSEINRKACPDRSPLKHCPKLQVGVLLFSPTDYIRYSNEGTHPEYVIRLDRLLILADQRHNLGIIGRLARGLKQKLLETGKAAPVDR